VTKTFDTVHILVAGEMAERSGACLPSQTIRALYRKIILFRMSGRQNPVRLVIERWFDPSAIDPLS
jgi:hypothetical protein